MAKFFRCWVIVDGSVPTSFRARDPEDLIPTLKQLQRTQPAVALKWFERGRLWDSPEAARVALVERRRAPTGRGKDWRPGGDHRDPRTRYDIPRDEKRARFKKRLIARKTAETRGPSHHDRPPRADAPFRQRETPERRPDDRRKVTPWRQDSRPPAPAARNSRGPDTRGRSDRPRPQSHADRDRRENGRRDDRDARRPFSPKGPSSRRPAPGGRPPRRRNDK